MTHESDAWNGPFSWEDVELIRDGAQSEPERMAALDRLAEGVMRIWKTFGLYGPKREVPEDYGHALATSARCAGIRPRQMKLRYIHGALLLAAAEWSGEKNPAELQALKKRTLKEANSALAGDSNDRRLTTGSDLDKEETAENALSRLHSEYGWDTHQDDEAEISHLTADEGYLVLKAVASPQQSKIVHYLHENPNAKHGEIARSLGLSTTTIRVQFSRLRSKAEGM